MSRKHVHPDESNACPRCRSGSSGYRYTVTTQRIVEGDWGDQGFAADEHELSISMVECIGCGARFRFERMRDAGFIGDDKKPGL